MKRVKKGRFLRNDILDPDWSAPGAADPYWVFNEDDRVVIIKEPYYLRFGIVWLEKYVRDFADPSITSRLYGVCIDDSEDCDKEENLVLVRPQDMIFLYPGKEIENTYDSVGYEYANMDAAVLNATAEHLWEEYGGDVMAIATFGEWKSDGNVITKDPDDIVIPDGWVETGDRDDVIDEVCFKEDGIANIKDEVIRRITKKIGYICKDEVSRDVENFVKGREEDCWGVRGYVTYYAPKSKVRNLPE